MAKSSKKKTVSSTSSEIRAAVKELRDFYQLGLEVMKADQDNPNNRTYSKGVTVSFAKQIGKSRDYVDKSRQFATNYTKKQLDELCELRRPDGKPLGRRNLVSLLSVKVKAKRTQLQRKAAKESWSTRRLTEEIQNLLGSRSSGGRRPRPADSAKNAMTQIVKMSEQWARWKKGIDAKIEEPEAGFGDLPSPVQKQLTLVMKEIKKLEATCQASLRKIG